MLSSVLIRTVTGVSDTMEDMWEQFYPFVFGLSHKDGGVSRLQLDMYALLLRCVVGHHTSSPNGKVEYPERNYAYYRY